MATDRAVVYQTNQIGVEATSGVAVTTNRRLLGSTITPTINTAPKEYGPKGAKYNTIVVNGKEWITAALDGEGSYTELAYWLSGMFGAATITTPSGGGGTLSKQWVWTPKVWGPDPSLTYTVETGSSVYADRFTFGLMNTLHMAFSRDDVTFTGNMLGQLISEGVTMGASPTDVATWPIQPKEINVYLDPTAAALGTTKLTRAIDGSWNIQDKQGIIWPMDRAQTSWAANIEKKPTADVTLTLGADSNAMAFITNMRNADTRFVRFEALGPIIESTVHATLWCDFAVKILNPPTQGDVDGLLTQPYNFRIVYDSTWGNAAKFTLISPLVAL